jgi:hypothetical protein
MTNDQADRVDTRDDADDCADAYAAHCSLLCFEMLNAT